MKKNKLSLAIFLMLFIMLIAALMISAYFSRKSAWSAAQEQLKNFTLNAANRIDQVLYDAKQALILAESLNSEPCTPEHMAGLRIISLKHRYVQEIIHTENGRLRCSTLQENIDGIPLPPPDYKYKKTLSMWYKKSNSLNRRHHMFYLGLGKNLAVIDTKSFLDMTPIHANSELALLDTENNELIAAWSGKDGREMRSAILNQSINFTVRDRYYNVLRSENLPVALIASIPTEKITNYWLRRFILWIPMVLVLSTLCAWIILRFSFYRQSLPYQIEHALHKKQFYIQYQPIVDLASGRCVGAEALLRWKLEDGTQIAPDIFIPLAEKHGVIKGITKQVIELVFADLGKYLEHNRDMYISINISSADAHSLSIIEHLSRNIKQYNVLPKQICVELTEHGAVNANLALPVLNKLRDIGHPIYIDDFGTGHSSLSYLQALPIDSIKIDKTFVNTIAEESVTSQVSQHIISMAKDLNINVIAEGVETERQFAYLKTNGAQFGQGWLFSKPMLKKDLLAYLSFQKNNLK